MGVFEQRVADLVRDQFGSIAEFARIANLNEQTLHSLFSRGSFAKARLETVTHIANTLEVDPNALMAGRLVSLSARFKGYVEVPLFGSLAAGQIPAGQLAAGRLAGERPGAGGKSADGKLGAGQIVAEGRLAAGRSEGGQPAGGQSAGGQSAAGQSEGGRFVEPAATDERFPVQRELVDRHPGAFLLRVADTSMNRILPEGCYALVHPCSSVEHQGQPHVVVLGDADAVIRRVNLLANGIELVPDSSDVTWKPQVIDYSNDGTEPVCIVGRVVWYCLPLNWRFE